MSRLKGADLGIPGVSYALLSKSSAYTMTPTDDVVLVSGTSTVALPSSKPTVDAVGHLGFTSGLGTTSTFTVVTTKPNELIVITTMCPYSHTATSSVTVDGSAATVIASQTGGFQNAYYYVAPLAGTHTVSVTLAAASNFALAAAWSLLNADAGSAKAAAWGQTTASPTGVTFTTKDLALILGGGATSAAGNGSLADTLNEAWAVDWQGAYGGTANGLQVHATTASGSSDTATWTDAANTFETQLNAIAIATAATATGPTVGKRYTVKNTGTGIITVVPPFGTIDGAASVTIQTQYNSLDFVTDGSNWFTV